MLISFTYTLDKIMKGTTTILIIVISIVIGVPVLLLLCICAKCLCSQTSKETDQENESSEPKPKPKGLQRRTSHRPKYNSGLTPVEEATSKDIDHDRSGNSSRCLVTEDTPVTARMEARKKRYRSRRDQENQMKQEGEREQGNGELTNGELDNGEPKNGEPTDGEPTHGELNEHFEQSKQRHGGSKRKAERKKKAKKSQRVKKEVEGQTIDSGLESQPPAARSLERRSSQIQAYEEKLSKYLKQERGRMGVSEDQQRGSPFSKSNGAAPMENGNANNNTPSSYRDYLWNDPQTNRNIEAMNAVLHYQFKESGSSRRSRDQQQQQQQQQQQ